MALPVAQLARALWAVQGQVRELALAALVCSDPARRERAALVRLPLAAWEGPVVRPVELELGAAVPA